MVKLDSKSREQLELQRTRIALWIDHKSHVYDLIQSGSARGFIPRVVAQMAIRYLESVGDIELDRMIDIVREAEVES